MKNDTRHDSSIVFYLTEEGHNLAEKIAGIFPSMTAMKFDSSLIKNLWPEHNAFIFIMAAGIVVRTIAPLLKDKRTDPGVVVLDEKGKYAISLAGGHLGGANDLARELSRRISSEAVITTASDVNDLPSLDIWARDNGLVVANWDSLSKVSARLVSEKTLTIYSESDIQLPAAFRKESDPKRADVIITKKQRVETCGSCVKNQLYLRPRNLVVGIGCNSGTSEQEIEDAVKSVLRAHNLSFLSIRSLATITIKADEPGLLEFAGKHEFQIRSFSADELNKVGNVAKSEAVFKATGAHAVSEPAALLASGTAKPLVRKQKSGNVTVAVALMSSKQSQVTESRCGSVTTDRGCEGKLYIVGTGPGDSSHITPCAKEAIADSDVIVGYNTYLELIPDLIAGKELFSTGMTQEIDRCRKAVELALSGRKVSVISGGDPGIYAMAGLVYEILKSEDIKEISSESRAADFRSRAAGLSVEVIPGISALNAAAARLGAPLMHDFVCISLSDRLTPWDVIEKRLDAAAVADFVIVLYNPKSKGRAEHFSRAVEIIRQHRKPETPVGIVRAAMRTSEGFVITNLKEAPSRQIDMQTTVIIGNSTTFVWNNRMITPRGYEKKLGHK